MAFPSNPTNGQITTQNGIVYTYNSTLTAWTVGTQTAGNISGNNINITSSAAVGTTLTVTGAATLSSTLAVTANITGGNILTAGIMSSTGNGIHGNILTAGIMSSTGNLQAGNMITGGTISATGNISTSGATTVVGIRQRNTAGGVNSPSAIFTIGTSTKLDVHINTSVAGGGATNTQQYGMSFTTAGGNTQAAIVCSENGATGTALGFFTSGNYAGGPVYRGGYQSTGELVPGANATQDLGTTSLRWRTVYTSDLDLNNGIGDWTIVEGEDDLFLYNNKKGRVYKFALVEVDPVDATPKIDELK